MGDVTLQEKGKLWKRNESQFGLRRHAVLAWAFSTRRHCTKFRLQWKSARKPIFTRRWRRTGRGLKWNPTDAAGIRRTWRSLGGPIAPATGRGRTAGGIGSAMNRGRGPVTTTGAGSITRASPG